MSDELLERIANALERNAKTLERIEIVLEEKQNKTADAKECRALMQSICKYYKETEPYYEIQIGDTLQVYRLRNAIAVIKNIRNTRHETRALNKCLGKLEEFKFISRTNHDVYQVLDTGQDWSELK